MEAELSLVTFHLDDVTRQKLKNECPGYPILHLRMTNIFIQTGFMTVLCRLPWETVRNY